MSLEYFLMIPTALVLILASIQDIKERHIYNMFSLMLLPTFTITAMIVFSILSETTFIQFLKLLLLGFGAFIIMTLLGGFLYLAKFFEKGDFFLFAAMGPALIWTLKWYINLELIVSFIIIFLVFGAIYTLILKGLEKTGIIKAEQGLPFVPNFLLSFAALAVMWISECNLACTLSGLPGIF